MQGLVALPAYAHPRTGFWQPLLLPAPDRMHAEQPYVLHPSTFCITSYINLGSTVRVPLTPAAIQATDLCDLLIYQAGADSHIDDPLGGPHHRPDAVRIVSGEQR